MGQTATMPSVYDLKPKFQSLLRPMTDGLARAGITANQITIAAMLLSLAAGAVIFCFRTWHALLLLPVVLFVRMALNAIDGMLAREHNQKTALGAVLNELGDVVSDSAFYLPLAVIPGFNPGLVVLVVLFSAFTEMTGVVATQIGASRRYDGPMGKSDRALVFGALGLLLGLGVPIASVIVYILGIVLALLFVTILNRSRRAFAELRSRTST
jgi:CDP-diacylglycerol---glycerol-3-phosphate 3-phosphatidyltransferase